MQLNITARHLDLTPALSDYVHLKVEKAQRFVHSIVWAQTILSVEKHRHIAEIVVHMPGNTFRTQGVSGDLYSAIDLAAHKLDIHLARVKDKSKDHRNGDKLKSIRFKAPAASPIDLLAGEAGPAKAVSQVTKMVLEPRSLSGAIRELDSQRMPFLLFINERTNQVSAIYKKDKGTYALIETVVP